MIYTLTQHWQEPSEGSAVHSLDLTDAEAKQVQEAIDWLSSHGGDNIGDTLSEFNLVPEPKLSGEADHVGLEAAMWLLALGSRYLSRAGVTNGCGEGKQNRGGRE